jgi:nucleoside phosphorylase
MGAIAVFVALRAEISALRVLLTRVRRTSDTVQIDEGEINGVDVVLVRSGVGKGRALVAAQIVCDRYRPEAVLSTGFCGGLVAGLRPSDVVLSAWIDGRSDPSSTGWERISLHQHVTPLLEALDRNGIQARSGGFVCVSQPVIFPVQRRALARATGAIVAEMETFHLGSFFGARRVPLMGVRTVLDGLEDPAPQWLLPVVGSRAGPGVFQRLRRPIRGGFDPRHFWKLYKAGRAAQASLARSVSAIIGSWPSDAIEG